MASGDATRTCKRLASIMTLSEFLRRFLFHLATACSSLFIVLFVGEYFVPGSVLPFINLIDATLVVLGLLVLAAIVHVPHR